MPRPLVTSACALAIATLAPCASALERQWHVGPDVGWGAVFANGNTYGGFGAGAHATYGANDWLNLELSLAATRHSDAGITIASATGPL